MVRIGGLGIHYRAFCEGLIGVQHCRVQLSGLRVSLVVVWNRESHSTAKLRVSV